MKIVVLFILLSVICHAFPEKVQKTNRGDFQAFQVNPNADISKLKMPKNQIKNIKRKPIVLIEYRDAFLAQNVPEISKNWDDLNKDLFVKRLEFYKQTDFLKKYPKIDVIKYKSLKKSWNPDV